MKTLIAAIALFVMVGTALADWFLVDTTISQHPGTAHIVGNQQETHTSIVNRYKKMGACMDALSAYLNAIEKNWKGRKTDIGYYRTSRMDTPSTALQIEYYSNDSGLMDQYIHLVQCQQED